MRLKGFFTCRALRRLAVRHLRLLLATRERVVLSSDCHLIIYLIFFQLVLYVFFYSFCILSYCVYIISSAPKCPVPVFILQVPVPLMYDYTTLSFQKSHKSRHAHLWRYFYKHMDMIYTYFCLYYVYLSIHIILAVFFLFLPCTVHRTLSAYTSVQTLYDICNSNSYVLNYYCHAC